MSYFRLGLIRLLRAKIDTFSEISKRISVYYGNYKNFLYLCNGLKNNWRIELISRHRATAPPRHR